MNMSGELLYCRSDQTAFITPDALRIRFKQSSFPVVAQQGPRGPVLLIGDDAEITLTENAGYVESLAVHAKFVGQGSRMRRICELLESMGWERANG